MPTHRDDAIELDFPIAPVTGFQTLMDGTLRVYSKYFFLILLYDLLFFGPLYLLKDYLEASPAWQSSMPAWLGTYDVTDWIWLGWMALVNPCVYHAVLRGMKEGKPASLFTSLGWGLRCWGRSLVYTMAAEFVLFAGFFIIGTNEGLWGNILGGLLIPGGIVLAVRYALVTPIVTVEGRSQKDVLGRSKELTEGRRMKLALSYLGLTCVYAVVTILLNYLGEVLLGATEGPVVGGIQGHWVFGSFLGWLDGVFFSSLTIMTLVAYLAWAKERPFTLPEAKVAE